MNNLKKYVEVYENQEFECPWDVHKKNFQKVEHISQKRSGTTIDTLGYIDIHAINRFAPEYHNNYMKYSLEGYINDEFEIYVDSDGIPTAEEFRDILTDYGFKVVS